ncbi:MAG: hypothetical protein AAGI38_02070 [Bacteroidota bacterium]
MIKTTFSILAFLLACQFMFAQHGYQRMNYQLPLGYSTASVADALVARFSSLQQPGTSLKLQHDITSPGGRHLHYTVQVDGIPVHESGVKVNVGQSSKIFSVNLHLKEMKVQEKVGGFQMSMENLEFGVMEEMGAQEVHSSMCWWPEEGKLIAAYLFEAFIENGTRQQMVIKNAATGEEIHRADMATYSGHKTHSTPRGRIFNPDPCTVAETTYGVQFSDNNDMHLPIFDALMDTVELKDLTQQNGVYELSGPYVAIKDLAFPFRAPATSATGDFFFKRDESGFEDVMAYYHIDSMQRYVQALGFTNLYNRPIDVDAHGRSDDQSAFISNNGNSRLVFGEGGVDDAEDADVIIHEYGHALSFAAAPGSNSGNERRGLDEGLCDYFAAGYSFDISIFRWDEIFNWDGHNPFWPGRTVNSGLIYVPGSTGGLDIYTIGEMWASAMMQIRIEAGGTVADRLQLQALYASTPNMTLEDAAKNVLDADSLLFNKANEAVIKKHFCARNLLRGDICLVTTIDPEDIDPLWAAVATGEGNFNLKWLSDSLPSEPTEIRVFDTMGKLVGVFPVESLQETEMQANLGSGLYILGVFVNGSRKSNRKLVIW